MKSLLCTLLTVCFAVTASAGDRPNIMVFLVDDMGVMDTSVPFLTDENGEPKRYPLNDYYRTPGMERIAESGIRFNQFYAMSVCSPTRISIMTGQNAARHHATNWINPYSDNAGENGPPQWDWKGLQPGDTTLPALLSESGYLTIHVGKGHFAPHDTPGADPSTIGFDKNLAGASFGAPGSYYGEQNYGGLAKGRRKQHSVPDLEKYHGTDTFLTEALTIETKALIDDAAKDERPFYLYFSHYAVHGPFESDPRFAANYADSGKPESAQAFATLIEGMDKSLNDMLEHFDKLGISEDTLVIFLGDNGTDAPLGDQHVVACAEPLRGKKGAHYEGGMRVPFIATWAKPNPENKHQKALPIPSGAIQSQVASVEDLFPTILSLVEAQTPADHKVDGKPLRKLLTGEGDSSRAEQFLMHYPHGTHRSNYFTTWRDGDWKVIYHALPNIPTHGKFIQSDGAHYQLFNLADDPFESNDLASSEPEKLKSMMSGLIEQLDAHDAQYPINDDGQPLAPALP